MEMDYTHYDEDKQASTYPGIVGQVGLIRELLEEAGKYNLQAEVVTWALKAMQEDPTLEPYEAFGYGYHEWVK